MNKGFMEFYPKDFSLAWRLKNLTARQFLDTMKVKE
jgi:hypothetical protein